jgi:hypothetical protein
MNVETGDHTASHVSSQNVFEGFSYIPLCGIHHVYTKLKSNLINFLKNGYSKNIGILHEL